MAVAFLQHSCSILLSTARISHSFRYCRYYIIDAGPGCMRHCRGGVIEEGDLQVPSMCCKGQLDSIWQTFDSACLFKTFRTALHSATSRCYSWLQAAMCQLPLCCPVALCLLFIRTASLHLHKQRVSQPCSQKLCSCGVVRWQPALDRRRLSARRAH